MSIRVEAEEYEREVAPIIVIQTPDPLLRLQVKWFSTNVVKTKRERAGEATKIEHEDKLWEKAGLFH